MEWQHYLAVFFSGVFFSNAIPHLVHGVSGDRFPTPFAKPPGEGLSSSLLNVLWAGLNLFIGFVLVRVGKLHADNYPAMAVFFAGFLSIALLSSIGFRKKHKA